MLWHTDRRWCCRLCLLQTSRLLFHTVIDLLYSKTSLLHRSKDHVSRLLEAIHGWTENDEKKKKGDNHRRLGNAGGHIKCCSEPQTMSECHVGRLQFWFQNMFLQSTRHRRTQEDLSCVFNSTTSRFYPFFCRTALQWDPSWDFLHFPSRPFSQEPHQTFLNNATGQTNPSGWWESRCGHGDLISHFIS